eukprot:Opistho-1_new@32756
MDGRNIADFIDPDIAARLEELDREEEERVARGDYDSDQESYDEEDRELDETAAKISARKTQIIQESREKRGKNRPTLPRKAVRATRSEFDESMASVGLDTQNGPADAHYARGRSRAVKRKRGDSESRDDENAMEVDEDEGDAQPSHKKAKRSASASAVRSASASAHRSKSRTPRDVSGFRDEQQIASAESIKRKQQRAPNMEARASESDRKIQTKMPKHLFAGKRKGGKT